ncbi:MAG TPA: HAMP domain-containing sensor histidine kinase [Longimicrobium sp.]|nr:HAMP domain-containing sensor histidine kinase [Longimicrobium sp.]
MSEEVQRTPPPVVVAASAVRGAGSGALPLPPPERPRAAPAPTSVQLSEFLAHELASPVSVLMGVLYLLSAEQLEGRAAELAGRAFQAARDMAETVEDLRALAGAVPRGDVSAADAAAEALEWVAGRVPGVRLRLKSTRSCEGAKVLGHRGLLRRAVRNLAQNAAEATGPGGTVGVVVRAAGDRVRITVWDDGPGIPPEYRAAAFTRPFTTRPGGTGLGLLLVRAVAEVHGGTVSLHPRAPRGAIFRIDLPRAPAARAAG